MVVSQPRSPEPPRSTRRGRGACPWSSRERASKARTAFLVAPLAMVDGECMGLHGPALISTCCHSALAARAATGAPTVTAVTLRVVREYLWVPFRATGCELDAPKGVWHSSHYRECHTCAVLSNSNHVPRKGTHKYVRSARVASERSRSDGYNPPCATSQE